MMLSPFTPLFFIDHKTDGIGSEYIQTFASSDRILIELIGPGDVAPAVCIYSEPGHIIYDTLTLNKWRINNDSNLYFFVLSLPTGLFTVEIEGIGISEPIRVTDNPIELAGTTLIQYSSRNNRQRDDVVFFISGVRHFFDFRVPGGFKDSGWAFSVDTEQFTTASADISQLYGLESTQKTFTLGRSMGVPVWFGEMLNRILTCTHVYFDGDKYCRKESSTPELSVQLEGVNSFVFTQVLQRSIYLDPHIEQANRICLRRAGNVLRSSDATSQRIII